MADKSAVPEKLPTVLIKYKDSVIESLDKVNWKPLEGEANLKVWTRIKYLNPTATPKQLIAELPNGNRFSISIDEIDIAHGGMADMLFNEDSNGED